MTEQDSAASADAFVGSVVLERYRILALLGKGGMGKIYAAWHMGLDQRVAFKLLRRGPNGELDAVARQRFQREARAAARIRSDHVCRVIDNGALEDGTPFLVMEYLEGCDLAVELRRRGHLPVPEAVRYVRQACAALAEAHRAGIVHRDLKPANLFLQQTLDSIDPRVEGRRLKVLDFGISKTRENPGSAELPLTSTAALLGSPIYMSPEQLNASRDVDSRSDVWALGVILYELVTGARPFDHASVVQVVNAVLYRAARPCSSHGLVIPRALEKIIERALSKDRRERYQTVAELSLALAPFERQTLATPELSPTLLLPPPDPSALSLDWESEESSGTQIAPLSERARPGAPRRSRWRLLAWALFAVLVGVVGTRALWPRQQRVAAARAKSAAPSSAAQDARSLPRAMPAELAIGDWLPAPEAAPSVEAVPLSDERVDSVHGAAEPARSDAGTPESPPRRRALRETLGTAPQAPASAPAVTDPLSAFGGRR